MKNKVYDPGDIKIIGMKMTNYNKSATRDIRGQVISLSIFEDSLNRNREIKFGHKN